MDKIAIAENLRMLRGERSQSAVANAIGVVPSTYSMWETAQRTPSDEMKEAIADYYGKTVQEIFFTQQGHKM